MTVGTGGDYLLLVEALYLTGLMDEIEGAGSGLQQRQKRKIPTPSRWKGTTMILAQSLIVDMME